MRGVINCMSWLLMSVNNLTRLIGLSLTVHLVAFVCLPGSGRSTLLIIIRFGSGPCLLLDWRALVP